MIIRQCWQRLQLASNHEIYLTKDTADMIDMKDIFTGVSIIVRVKPSYRAR